LGEDGVGYDDEAKDVTIGHLEINGDLIRGENKIGRDLL